MKNEEYYELEENLNSPRVRSSIGSKTNSLYFDNSQENKRTYLSNNNNERVTEQIKAYSHLNGSYQNQKSNTLLESEEIFMNQKKEIEKMKQRNLQFSLKRQSLTEQNKLKTNIKNYQVNEGIENISEINVVSKDRIFNNNRNEEGDEEEDDYEDDVITFSLKDNKYFEVSLFDFNEKEEERPQIPEIKESWKPFSLLYQLYSEREKHKNSYNNNDEDENYNYIEFNRIALRVIQEIDFSLRGIKLYISINLFGESELWIFTRSSVNKSINEIYYFDEKSANVEEYDNFNKYSSVIKIMKNKGSNKCFVSFGTFYEENDNHNLYYKSFLKRQLIDYSYDRKNYNPQIDKCELDIYVTDFGEEIINTQIFLNNNKRFDDISAKFFLPINKKAKLLICGNGESLKLKDLEVKIYDKEKANMNSIIQFESDNETPKSCECCSII